MNILELLKRKRVLSDGAWGTELQRRGLPPGACTEEWNRSHPEEVAGVARSYVEAGSQIILTNTFGANRFVLGRHGMGTEVGELARLGARLSRKAAGEGVAVAGSVGPTGKLLLMGEVSEEELYGAFKYQVLALEEGGADAIVVETMLDVEEASVAIRAAKESTRLPVIASMTYDAGPDKTRTQFGLSPKETVPLLVRAGADAVGANCGVGIESYVPVTEAMRAVTALPLWVKPNAGLPVEEEGRSIYKQMPEEFASYVPQLLEKGANIVGGCCGTSPAHVRLMAALLG